MTVSLVAAMCVVMTSCLKNDNTSYVSAVEPAAEDSLLQAFIDSTGYNMVTTSDSLYTYTPKDGGGFELVGFKLPYLYYEVVDEGDKSPDPIEIPYKDLGSPRADDALLYGNLTDTTEIISVTYTGTLLNGKVFDKTDEGKPYFQQLFRLLIPWRVLIGKVGRGGHIRILTPSLYGYANSQQPGIPVNSPLFFDIHVLGFVNDSRYAQ